MGVTAMDAADWTDFDAEVRQILDDPQNTDALEVRAAVVAARLASADRAEAYVTLRRMHFWSGLLCEALTGGKPRQRPVSPG